MNSIKISEIPAASPLHPLTVFADIAFELAIEDCEMDTSYDSLVYTFSVHQSEATQEFIDALNFVAKTTGQLQAKCRCEAMTVSYVRSKRKNESLVLKSFYTDEIRAEPSGNFVLENCRAPSDFRRKPNMEIHIYDKGKAWNYTAKNPTSVPKGFPCSMKDFFYYQNDANIEKKVFLALFHSWSKSYPIWKDLAADFDSGTAYSSIPLDVITSCRTRRELMKKRYGMDMKRNNRACIGDSIFLARAERIIEKDELQKLFGFHVYPCFISRTKMDLVKPLTFFLHESLKKIHPDMTITIKNRQTGQKEPFRITKEFIEDAVSMSISLRRKIPLSFKSLNRVRRWHDELAFAERNRQLPTVRIPKNSRFKNLRMPDNCIRLTSRKMFVEEGNYQNNCVATYIYSVNDDRCSIWSMRKDDGSRNTIEIGIRKNRFFIRQFLGYGNLDAPSKDRAVVKAFLENQLPDTGQ